MSSIDGVYGTGDNKEFTVPTAKEITIYFYNNLGKTSVDDDPTIGVYYLDNPRVAAEIILRYNQSLEITHIGSIKNTTLTDPITCAIGDGTVDPAAGMWKERYQHPTLHYIKINVQTDNTNLKIRVY